MDPSIYRLLDANFNRAREGIRVVEDCARFVLDDPALSGLAKNLRSQLQAIHDVIGPDVLLTSRDTPGDVGTALSTDTELARADLQQIVSAACKRLTEALRTVEEYTKLIAPSAARQAEQLRYQSYTLEQRILGRLATLDRMNTGGLYAIVSSHLCVRSVPQTVKDLLAGGVKIIQLREKDTPDDQFYAMAAEVRQLTTDHDAMFIVNDRADIAAMSGADGVHLGQDDLPLADVRRLLRPGALVGRSTHSMSDVSGAIHEGADYIGFGAIFDTTTKTNPICVGTDLLTEVLSEVPSSLPVVAIGGITLETLPLVRQTGASWVAVSSALCQADDPQITAREFITAMAT
jgi:thiamine-phosphate pyrophosphorylase